MSNVSPQQVPRVQRTLSVFAGKAKLRAKTVTRTCGQAVSRIKRSGAGTGQSGEPLAYAAEAPSKWHGAEAPKKSNLRSSSPGEPTRRQASLSRRSSSATHEAKSVVRYHPVGKDGSLWNNEQRGIQVRPSRSSAVGGAFACKRSSTHELVEQAVPSRQCTL